MLDGSILLGFALLGGGLLSISPAPTATAAVVALVVLRHRLTVVWWAVALAALAVGALRAGHQVAVLDRERAAEHRPLIAGWDAELSNVECEGRRIDRSFRARLYGGPDDLARGDRVAVIAGLAPLQLFHNEDLGDPRPSAVRRGTLASGGTEDVRVVSRAFGPTALIDRLRARVRKRIEATFVPEAAPMARALVLGESDLDPADNQAFRASGLAHLLAVSGTHLVLVVAGAVSATAALLRRLVVLSRRCDVGRPAAALGVIFAWVYADFAGGSGSARRAAAMLSFALGARAFGSRPDGPRAFGLSLIGAALVDPLIAFDLSFLLSAAATAGLMTLQRPLAAWLEAWGAKLTALRVFRTEDALALPVQRRPRALVAVAAAVATTLSATIGCAPLIAFLTPTLPIGGVPANLLAVPLGELLALPLCLAHVVLGVVPLAERGDALVASGSLLVVRAIARMTEQISWLGLPVPPPSPWQCAILFCATLAVGWGRRSRRASTVLVAAALFLVCEMEIRRDGAPEGKLRVTVLDIGQGDASIVDLPDGRALLVDAGGMVGSPIDTGQAVVAPMLRVRRRSALAAAVLSHPHPDHFGGLASALAQVSVGEFWDTGQGEREGAGPVYAALLGALRARGIPVVRPASLCGSPRVFGKATVEILAPCPAPIPFINANDNSLVLRVSFGERAALLVGDAEREEEQALLAKSAGSLRADFLKVGHHGSRTSSSPAFLRAVGAKDAAISCGVRNRFGHPHPFALQNLGVIDHLWRTDRDGSIRWETDGQTSRVVTAGADR
jgi:competence protein ComEC